MIKFDLNKDFQPFYYIEKPEKGRRFIITDIHGHFYTFLELLDQINFTKEDQLFLLGDMVDRGKNCPQILDWIMDRLDNNYLIYPLRGNHEEMAWESHSKEYTEEELKLPRNKWGKNIVDKKRKIDPQYINIIDKLPYYYEVNDYYLVHAGFDFIAENPFTEYKYMVWHTNEDIPSKFAGNKRIIHGHTMTTKQEIIKSIEENKQIVCLDNGVFISKKDEYGSLVCLNLDNNELFFQVGID